MQIVDIKKFQALMYGIGEYYNREISEMLMEIYWEGLKQHEYEAVSRAAQLHMKNPEGGQFFPKLGDFNRHLTGSNQDKALQAWAKVDKAVRTIGPYRSVVFDDPVIHAVIADMGGWIGLGNCSEETEWPFRQNEFAKRYRGIMDRGGVESYLAKLTGIADMHNRTIGKQNEHETVLLGDQEKAMAILQNGASDDAKTQYCLLSERFKNPLKKTLGVVLPFPDKSVANRPDEGVG